MANRNNRLMGNRRMDFNRMDRNNGLLPRPMPQVSPWQQGSPSMPLNNMLPLASNSEATLALANNLINNLLQSRQNPVPSLLDVPVQRNFPMQDFNRGMNRMGNQPNFRRGPGNFSSPITSRPVNRNNKNFRPLEANKRQPNNQRRDDPKFKNKQSYTPAKKSQTPKKEDQPKKEGDEENKAADGDVVMKSEDKTDETSAESKDESSDKKDAKGQRTPYDGIAPALLHCHICNKGMWDGRSFDNHINGRAHHMMMEKTSESYALTADTIRQELKINEMKSNRRMGKAQMKKFYCPMCDLYASDSASHRNSLGHRKLKRFLHPSCTLCSKEMPTRIDLDEHKLSVEHLTMLQTKQGPGTVHKQQNMTISTLLDEEGYLHAHTDRKGRKRDAKGQATDRAKLSDEGGEKVEGDEKGKEGEKTEGGEDAQIDVNAIIDVAEGQEAAELADKDFPKYSIKRGVGTSFICEQTIFECRLCNKYLDSAETAAVHAKTWKHHTLFIKHLEKLLGKKKSGRPDVKKEAEDGDGESESKKPRLNTSTANGDDSGDVAINENDIKEENEEDIEQGDAGEEEGDAGEEEGGEGEEAGGDAKPEEGRNAAEEKSGDEWEKDIEELINAVPETDKAQEEEKQRVVEEKVKATPSKRGRGRGRGRGARR